MHQETEHKIIYISFLSCPSKWKLECHDARMRTYWSGTIKQSELWFLICDSMLFYILCSLPAQSSLKRSWPSEGYSSDKSVSSNWNSICTSVRKYTFHAANAVTKLISGREIQANNVTASWRQLTLFEHGLFAHDWNILFSGGSRKTIRLKEQTEIRLRNLLEPVLLLAGCLVASQKAYIFFSIRFSNFSRFFLSAGSLVLPTLKSPFPIYSVAMSYP